MQQRPFKHEESSIARQVALLDSSFLLGLGHEAGGARGYRMDQLVHRGVIFVVSNSVMRRLHQCTLDPVDEPLRDLAKSVIRSFNKWGVEYWSLNECAGGTVEELSEKVMMLTNFPLAEEDARLIIEAAILKVNFVVSDDPDYKSLDLLEVNKFLRGYNLGPVVFDLL